MTLKDIATEVGVSISTVSRVVNSRNIHAASPEIQQAIWECVRKTGYKPNSKLRKSNANSAEFENIQNPLKVIACIFARDNISITDNSFFTGIVKSFERTALSLNYTTQNYFTAIEVNQRNIELLSGQHLDGVLVIGRHDKSLIEGLLKVVDHIIYAGLAHPASDNYDSVICDRYEIGKKATRYLMDLGHREIAYIGETEREITYNGFLDELKKANITPFQENIRNVYPSMEHGYTAMTSILRQEKRPTAVFCMNDYLAIGAIRAVHDLGLKCPEDISILGVDDIEAASYTTPKLTTIHTPMDELGNLASKLLIDRIEGGHEIVTKIHLPFKVIERESCKRIR